MVAVRFSKVLAARTGDGTRWSLKFKPSKRLKAMVRGEI